MDKLQFLIDWYNREEERKTRGGFLQWIKQFKKNRIYADPQLRYTFDLTPTDDQIVKCSREHLKDDKNEDEQIIG